MQALNLTLSTAVRDFAISNYATAVEGVKFR